MRRPGKQRNTVRYPLDDLLGTVANVRLLRIIIHAVAGPVSVTDAATMAGLSTTGARKALETLVTLGVVTRVGTGRAQKYGPVEHHPHWALLRQLFDTEQRQYENLLDKLRQAVSLPELRDVWIRKLPSAPPQILEIDVVAETSAVSWIGSELRTRLLPIEKQFGYTIELDVLTRADDPIPPKHAIRLWTTGGTADSTRPPGAQSQRESEDRSRSMATAIAKLLKTDPSLIRRALRHTNRLLREGQGTANSDIGEWRQLLETYSLEQLRNLLASQSSRAQRLRRSAPFFAVLTPEERDRMLELMEQER